MKTVFLGFFISWNLFASDWSTSAISKSAQAAVLGNMHALEIALIYDYMDDQPGANFMKCNDPHISRNACPVDRMGGLYVLVPDPNKGYVVANTFWGTQDESTWPSDEEIDAQAEKSKDAIGGIINFTFAGKKTITTVEAMQELRINTTINFYQKKLGIKSVNAVMAMVQEAAKVNHMDPKFYSNTKMLVEKIQNTK